MPTTKMSRFRGKSRRRRRLRRKPMTTGAVKRIIGAELKTRSFGVDFVDVFIGAANIVSLTPGIAQGSGATQREGNWIKPVILHGYVVCKGFDAAAAPTYGMRVTLCRWNENENANPISPTELYNDPASPGSHFNIITRGQYKVLYTRFFTIVNDKQNPRFTRTLKYYIRLSGAPRITYNAALPGKFHYFLVVTSDDLSLAEHPQYQHDGVFRFTDS